MVAPARLTECGGKDKVGKFIGSLWLIERNPVLQFALRCQCGIHSLSWFCGLRETNGGF